MKKNVPEMFLSLNKVVQKYPGKYKTMFKAKMTSIKAEYFILNKFQDEPFDLEAVQFQRELDSI